MSNATTAQSVSFKNWSNQEWKQIGRQFNEISIYVTTFICAVGLLGNILSLKVFFSTKVPRNSSRYYFITLAFADGIFLIVHFIDNTCKEIVQHFRLDFPFNITDQRQLMCRTFALLRATSRCMSPWILTCFTLERYLVFNHPQRLNVLSKPLVAKRVVLVVFLFSFLISIYNPLLMGVYSIKKNPRHPLPQYQYMNICDVLKDYRTIYLYLTLAYTIIVILVPILVVSVFNTLLIRRLYITRSTTEEWKTAMLIEQEQGISYREIREKRMQIENLKITWMLVIVSLSFIMLTVPHVIVYFSLNINQLRTQYDHSRDHLTSVKLMRLVEKITELFYILNHGINFFLYILSRNKFRHALIEKLKCRTLFGNAQRNNSKCLHQNMLE